MSCIFCQIVEGSIPTEKVYEDETVLAFKDTDPQAPIHFLIIPKKHISSTDDLEEEDEKLIGHIFIVAKKLASEYGLENGYRIVNNCGVDGGQSVGHIHFHMMGKRAFSWPAG